MQDKMAEENIPAPTRTDEYNSGILLERMTRLVLYSFQLDELWFDMKVDLLCNALWITPKDSAHPFMSPPAVDLVRPQSPLHIMANDYPLGNLKFVNKGGVDEVFGMRIPKDLITDVIQNSEYYKKYMEMSARKPRQPTTMIDEEGGKKKAPKDDKESQPATEPQVLDDEHSLQRGIQMSLESFQAPDTSSLANSTSKADTEIFNVDEEHGEEVLHIVALEERTVELDEGQVGSDPGPNPKPMHEDFIATVYPEVHESLKLTTEE
ncbi:hypothetical protein Tco_0943162 [Tanacetum coccineum]